jgi:hypothetical protein
MDRTECSETSARRWNWQSIPKRRHEDGTDSVFQNVGMKIELTVPKRRHEDRTDSVPKRRHEDGTGSVPKRRHEMELAVCSETLA